MVIKESYDDFKKYVGFLRQFLDGHDGFIAG